MEGTKTYCPAGVMQGPRDQVFRLGFVMYVVTCVVLILCFHTYVGTRIDSLWSVSVSCRDIYSNLSKLAKDMGGGVYAKCEECPPMFQMPEEHTSSFTGLEQLSPYNTHSNGSAKSKRETYDKSILILTPVSDSRSFLDHYFTLLCSLTYPHYLISIAIGEDSSTDDTFEYAGRLARQLRPHFRDIKVFHLEGEFHKLPYSQRHKLGYQRIRRAHLAKSRNNLLSRALDNETWVLWLDSDVQYFSPDLIQHLLSAKQPIVSANCLWHSGTGEYGVYDRNNWRESPIATEKLRKKSKNFLMLEGYGPSTRVNLRNIDSEGLVVPIDGVGGCVLLVKAACHRRGLVFPPFVFDHHIETEGLAKMAARMRIPVHGLPFVSAVH